MQASFTPDGGLLVPTPTAASPWSDEMVNGHQAVHTPGGLIALAWTLVGVPLAYGLYQTVKTAVTLFTG